MHESAIFEINLSDSGIIIFQMSKTLLPYKHEFSINLTPEICTIAYKRTRKPKYLQN